MKKNKISQITKVGSLLSVVLVSILFSSHDLYLKMDSYFLEPNQNATISLYNGTFEKSENIITRDRMLDASLVMHGERTAIVPDLWEDQDSTITYLQFTAGKPGTYVAGVSTKARNIELTAQKFNDYLTHDGVLDMLEYRTENDLLNQDAVESYQKHVKAIYQVGDSTTNDWNTILGYPIEFVPLENPYQKYSGETLGVKLLLDGKPLANQLVYANTMEGAHTHSHDSSSQSHEHKHDDSSHASDHEHEHKHGKKSHSHGHDHNKGDTDYEHTHKETSEEAHTHTSGQQLRTNEEGIVTVDLSKDGIYYLRTIHMINDTENEALTHQSKWATLTFEVSHKHDSTTHTHDDHDHEGGIPTWVFIVGSILLIVILFFVLRKKN